ncbi:MAG: FHA domain-containing protein [Chloroflexia bacterium]
MQQRCPSCGRAWVPGEVRCPFCGATPGAPAPPGMPAGSPPTLQLQWVDSRGIPQSRAISPQGLRLGRDLGNDVVLDDAQVSRQHAWIFLQGGQCYVQDLGSANGTWVNEQRITGSHPLSIGDRLRLGGVSLVLAAAPMPAPAVPVGYPYPLRPDVRPIPPAPVPAPRAAAQPVTLTPGRILPLAGGVILLVMFFLPWFQVFVGISAFDLLRALNYAGNQGVFSSTSYSWYLWFLLLVPLAGLVSLVLTIASLFVERRGQGMLFYPQIVLAVLSIGVQIGLLVLIQEGLSASGAPEVVDVTSLLDFGYWLSLVGAVLIISGSVLEIVPSRRRA